MVNIAESKYDQYEHYFVEDGETLAQIADEFELSYGALRFRAMKKKWGDKRKKYLEKYNKTQTEIMAKRIEEEAEKLDEKNKRRAKHWRTLQNLVILKIQSAANIFEKEHKVNLSCNEICALTTAYEKACHGERLEDGQSIAIKTIQTDGVGKDGFYEAIRDIEYEALRNEEEAERIRQLAKEKNITI